MLVIFVISHLVDIVAAVLLHNQIEQGLGACLVHRVAGQLHHLLVQLGPKRSLTEVGEAETIC